MPCFRPLKGYYGAAINKDTGKRSLVFTSDRGLVSSPVEVPCGRCIGCRLDRSLMWAVRCVHESQMHEDNCFLTLTYDDAHLPENGSLRPRDFVLFMKRLRERIAPCQVKFFHCGEYGDKGGRPHDHVLIFGWRPPDLVFHTMRNGNPVYLSSLVAELWRQGIIEVGDVTFQSAAYCARYVLKKWSADNLTEEDLYEAMRKYDEAKKCGGYDTAPRERMLADVKASVYQGRLPEYVSMSRRPGIGSTWFDRFKSDVYPHGFVVLPSGKKAKVPKFYENKFSIDEPVKLAMIKGEGLIKAQACPDNSPARLSVREVVKKLTIQQLRRGYEYEGQSIQRV